MPLPTKAIKRRISSVKSTRKITKAMELVAASKMRRAVEAAVASRPYSQYAWDMLTRMLRATTEQVAHPLLETREEGKTLVIVVTSNRGLCGGLNSNILRRTNELMATLTTPDFMSVGKKGDRALSKTGSTLVASFVDIGDTPTYLSIAPIARLAMDGFVKGTYNKVLMVYSEFVSAIAQKPTVRQILPLTVTAEASAAVEAEEEFLFEPSADAVLETMIPRLVEVQLYQGMLEAAASEHSARMVAMRNATDAAKDMLDDLVFSWNRARQASITKEIAEISSGMTALT